MLSDIDISYNAKVFPVEKLTKKIGIKDNDVELYGKYKAKLNYQNILKYKTGCTDNLILVTSTNPTPFGEGKTTMSIGLNDALNLLGKNSIVALREPSLGPVFGIKGGATGGGYSQVIPMEDINLHFTGDMHAITSCNNLLCAAIDNHIFQGNELNISKVIYKRCMDINDRALRNIEVAINNKGISSRKDGFVITVASEIMAILCLTKDLDDLKKHLSNILIGYDKNDKPIFVKNLGCQDAMTILLKDAIKPNIVQTLEHNPAIIHGGPFANIAHGCNSLIATNLAMHLADYVVTEAGFGADLGAEKFFDIKCRMGNIKPKVVVINSTVRSLRYNGECPADKINVPNLDCLKKGIKNLGTHIENVKKYISNVIVCLNKFEFDTDEEINYVKTYCENKQCMFCISECYAKGGKGAVELARGVLSLCENESDFKFLYNSSSNIKTKIETIAYEIYRANKVNYSSLALKNIKKIEEMNMDKLPVCIAKTQYSLSDNVNKLGSPSDYVINVDDISLSSGAGFVVCYMGNILTMPGLSKSPSMYKMKIDSQGKISGLF